MLGKQLNEKKKRSIKWLFSRQNISSQKKPTIFLEKNKFHFYQDKNQDVEIFLTST